MGARATAGTPCAASWWGRSALTRPVNREPSSAVPMTEPTCRAVLTAPEAMPARSGATLTSAAAVLGAMTRPLAAPNRTNSGQTWL